ncbi:MAG: diguanylate cyclase [Polyangiaceae bacterium]
MPTPEPFLRRGRVLFADDDPAVRAAIARTLRAHGFLVDLAADGTEALAFAREYPYALVATDHDMPGMNGTELIANLRKLQPDSRFLMVTGYAEAAQASSELPGVSGVLVKPWRDGELVELVSQAVEQASTRQRTRETLVPAGVELILMLEDSEVDALMLRRAIEHVASGEFQIVRFQRLADACASLKTREYAVVLSDLSLPDAEGLVALSELSAVSPSTPILVVTSADDEDQALRAVQAGAQDYLLKGGFDGERVLRAIRYAIERKATEKRLSELAHYDQLTHLANRTLLNDRLEQSLGRAARSGRRAALLLIDLDHFKAANDTYGHELGDLLLVEVANRLTASTRQEDTVARIGGDEFAVLLEELEDASGASRVAQRVLNAFATPLIVDGKLLPVTASIGVALYPDDASDEAALLRSADRALYRAKDMGRNSYALSAVGSGARGVRRAVVERELLAGPLEERLVFALQPLVDLSKLSVVGHELLLRFRSDDGEPIAASEFVPLLEQTGDLLAVGRWVLRSACELAELRPALGPLSINVSLREFCDRDFLDNVKGMLKVYDVAPGRLELELCESTLTRNLAGARTVLPQLAALGVVISVDDYGSGRSSLAELGELPISSIKLSPSLLRSAGTRAGRATLSAILGGSQRLWLAHHREIGRDAGRLVALALARVPVRAGLAARRAHAAHSLISAARATALLGARSLGKMRGMAATGRIRKRLALAIVLTALIPVLVSIWWADKTMRNTVARLYLPGMESHLVRSLDVYKELSRSVKSLMRQEAAAVAERESLRHAVRDGDKAGIERELSRAFAEHPSLVLLAARDPSGRELGHVERSRPLDPARENRLEVVRQLGEGNEDEVPSLLAVFAADRARFDEHLEMNQFVETYRTLEGRRGADEQAYVFGFALLLGITIVVAVGVGVLLARGVSERIAQLAEATQRVALGDLEIRVPERGSDELSDLARAFNRMLGEVADSRARLEYLQRIGAWQEMARRLAHEIKNPLTPIQLAAQEIHRRYAGEDPAFRKLLDTTLEIVEDEVGTLRRLVTEFSDFARLPQANLVREDLRAYLAEMAKQFKLLDDDRSDAELPAELSHALSAGSTSLSFELPAVGPAEVLMDRQMFRRVLVNLIQNAMHATRDVSQRAPRIVVRLTRRGDYYSIDVEDTGPGIPAEQRQRVFDPYVTTKTDGTGLGLAIVKKIVIEHGGSITASDSELGGARLSVRLPACGTRAAERAQSGMDRLGESAQNLRL